MKQNLLQTLSLILCLVLLVLVLGQNRQMQVQIDQLEYDVHQLRSSLTEEVRSISSQVRQELEESQRIVADYALQPRGISKEENALLADVSVTLKEWFSDTQVTFLATVGDRRSQLPAQSDGNGTFTAQLPIPLETSQEVSLSVKLSGSGKQQLEAIGTWGDISQLLPLQNTGGGWTGPNYVNGIMSSKFSVSIASQSGTLGPIENPHFQIYRNGQLVQTIPAVVEPHSASGSAVDYTVDTQGNRWSLECDPGDAIDIRFLCEDEYGLGYDFLFGNWLATEEASPYQSATAFQSGNPALALYWPE